MNLILMWVYITKNTETFKKHETIKSKANYQKNVEKIRKATLHSAAWWCEPWNFQLYAKSDCENKT